MTKLKKSSCDKTKKNIQSQERKRRRNKQQYAQTQISRKIQNSNCDKTKKKKKITQLKTINCDKTENIKL